MNNKKRQSNLYKMKAIVDYFNQPKEEPKVYADDELCITIKPPRRIFNGYKVIEAYKLFNPNTREYWYLFNKSKAKRV